MPRCGNDARGSLLATEERRRAIPKYLLKHAKPHLNPSALARGDNVVPSVDVATR